MICSYQFYAVFKDSEDFTVRCESDEIGTITNPPPIGDRFALAGRVWEVTDADIPRRLIYVKPVEGKMEISWPGDSGEIHTRILEKMRDVLFGETTYAYLLPNAAARLETARRLAKNTAMADHMVVSLGGSSFALFPWLGTRAFRTLRRLLLKNGKALGISDLSCEGCCYMTFKAWQADGNALLPRLRELVRDGLDPMSLVGEAESPAFDKYDPYIPAELLRLAYAADRLSPDEVVSRLRDDTRYQ